MVMSSDEIQRAEARMQELRVQRMILPPQGLKNLAAHQYKGGDYTPLDNFLNAKWWTPVSNYVPLWIAPNAITVAGLVGLVAAFGVMRMYAPHLEGEVPRWVFFLNAFALFAYQTLDAIDGKQARRTQSSSPLGQLMDHGCDSMSTIFITFQGATTIQIGCGVLTAFMMLNSFLPFFLTMWEEYHTGRCRTSTGWCGVTEAQVSSIGMMLLAGFFGTDFYSWKIFGLVELRIILLVWMTICCGAMMAISFINVYKEAQDKILAFKQIIPCMMMFVILFPWVAHNQSHPLLVLFILGLLASYLTSWMIVCSMAHIKYRTLQPLLFPLPFAFAIDYWDLAPRHTDVILGSYLTYVVYRFTSFAYKVVQELACYLGIYIFVLGKRTD